MFINGKIFKCKRYSSGEMKLLHDDLNKFVVNDKVEILFANKNFSFFELLIIIRYFLSLGKKVSLILAYLPYQRMDHNNGYEVETVKYVASLLNDFKLESLTICEPHCDLSYFKNAKKLSFVDLLCVRVFKDIGFNIDKDILFFTDKGSLERYHHLGKHFVTCEKVRDKATGLIVSYNLIGKIENNQKIVIIDDIISTGDTIMHAIDELKKHTNQKFFVVCGHYEVNKHNRRLWCLEEIEKIISTNSLSKRQNSKLELFSVKELIYDK